MSSRHLNRTLRALLIAAALLSPAPSEAATQASHKVDSNQFGHFAKPAPSTGRNTKSALLQDNGSKLGGSQRVVGSHGSTKEPELANVTLIGRDDCTIRELMEGASSVAEHANALTFFKQGSHSYRQHKSANIALHTAIADNNSVTRANVVPAQNSQGATGYVTPSAPSNSGGSADGGGGYSGAAPACGSTPTESPTASNDPEALVLTNGSALVSRKRPMCIQAGGSTIKIGSRVPVFVARQADTLVVFNLGDTHDGRLTVSPGNEELMDIEIGHALLVCDNSARSFEESNPFPAVSWKNLENTGIHNGKSVFRGSVVLQQVLENSPQFKEIVTSTRPEHRRLANKLLKTMSIKETTD